MLDASAYLVAFSVSSISDPAVVKYDSRSSPKFQCGSGSSEDLNVNKDPNSGSCKPRLWVALLLNYLLIFKVKGKTNDIYSIKHEIR